MALNARPERPFARFVFLTIALATGLTLFYLAHEQLPRSIRAPSAWLLAPIAIVDGLCYATGLPGIYGKTLPIFVVNWLFAAVLCALAFFVLCWWRRRD